MMQDTSLGMRINILYHQLFSRLVYVSRAFVGRRREERSITNANDFLGAVEARARHRGYKIGSRYAAECFGVLRLLGEV